MHSKPPSKEEVRDAVDAAMAVALAITQSRQRAEDVVQDAFERALTTRHWDRSKGPFDRYMAGVVRSLLNIAFHSAGPEREAKAHEGFYDEVAGRWTESAEVKTLEYAEAEERDARAVEDLERLRASVAEHPVAPEVLKCRERGIDKAAQIARELEVPVQKVYRANELLKEHLGKIWEARNEKK